MRGKSLIKSKRNEMKKSDEPFFLIIWCRIYMYSAMIKTLETTYIERTPKSTEGLSKGIFFDTCIITRMITRLNLLAVAIVLAQRFLCFPLKRRQRRA